MSLNHWLKKQIAEFTAGYQQGIDPGGPPTSLEQVSSQLRKFILELEAVPTTENVAQNAMPWNTTVQSQQMQQDDSGRNSENVAKSLNHQGLVEQGVSTDGPHNFQAQVSSQLRKFILELEAVPTTENVTHNAMSWNTSVQSQQTQQDDSRLNSKNVARSLNQKGLVEMNRGRFSESVALFTKAHSLLPDWYVPAFNLAAACYRQGQYATSIPWYTKSLDLAPPENETLEIRYWRAWAMLYDNERLAASRDCASILENCCTAIQDFTLAASDTRFNAIALMGQAECWWQTSIVAEASEENISQASECIEKSIDIVSQAIRLQAQNHALYDLRAKYFRRKAQVTKQERFERLADDDRKVSEQLFRDVQSRQQRAEDQQELMNRYCPVCGDRYGGVGRGLDGHRPGCPHSPLTGSYRSR